MSVERFMRQSEVTVAELAEALGVTAGAVHHKIAGRRGWSQDDIDQVLAYFTQRLGRRVTYEEAFAAEDASLPAGA